MVGLPAGPSAGGQVGKSGPNGAPFQTRGRWFETGSVSPLVLV